MTTSRARETGRSIRAVLPVFLLFAGSRAAVAEEGQAALHVAGDSVVMALHAVGVQIYECRAGAGGPLEWALKAPQADLFLGNERVGRHYAGPTWEHRDGSRITGTVLVRADASEAGSVPWLRLAVASHAGEGAFSSIAAVLRIDTQGGLVSGKCEAGALKTAPYQANYVFIRRP